MKKYLVIGAAVAGMIVGSSSAAMAGACSKTTSEGWGLTEELAKWQAQDMMMLATGNLIVQNDKISKPAYKCSSSLLGWNCKATAKICKK